MGDWFEWDPEKAKTNEAKHGVAFAEPCSVFLDSPVEIRRDDDHSTGEDRFTAIGMSHFRRLLVVVVTDRAERTRLISARRATSAETRAYEG